MKKLVLVLMVAVFFSASAFCQNVSDYFPVTTGNNWTYANSTGNTSDIVTVGNSTPDRDGTMLYLFENQTAGLGATSTMYSIKNNKVVILVKKDILGRYHEQKQPFPVELAPAGQEWRAVDGSEITNYRTLTSRISFDGLSYNDCIVVEERITLNNQLRRTKKSYYARNIGLVYVTLQSPGQQENVYRKLKDYNFTNETSQLWDFEGNPSGVTVTSYKGNAIEIIVPSTIGNIQVIGISSSEGGGQNSSGIIQMNNRRTIICTLSEGITFLGPSAFAYSNLTTLNIPDSVKIIDEYAFLHMSNISTITIGKNVEISPLSEPQFNDVSAFNFADFYNRNNKRKGVYRYINGAWNYSNR
jgi:hypothetical protein